MIRTRIFICAILATVCICLTNVQADPIPPDPLDLTSLGADGFINGAYFLQIDHSSTGTGVIDSFVRLQANGTERGYNTDGTREYDEKGGGFTRSLLLGEVPIVNIGGIDYREFLLDINQDKSANPSLLSLDTIKIYLSPTGSPTVPAYPGGLGTLIYDMDGPFDQWIKLDYALNSGSGAGDMFAYIPDSLFIGPYQNVILYSEFGGQGGIYETNAGFEEWAVQKATPIPTPTAVLLGMLGLSVMGVKLRKYA